MYPAEPSAEGWLKKSTPKWGQDASLTREQARYPKSEKE